MSAFGGHLGRLDIAGEMTYQLCNRSIEISKLKCKKEKKKPNTEDSRIMGSFWKDVMHILGTPGEQLKQKKYLKK